MIANLGLAKIIGLSIPVLMFLYPLSIVLTFLAMLSIKMGKRASVYKWTLALTGIAAFFDFLKNLPEVISKSEAIVNFLKLPSNFLPGFDLGFGWMLPALIGFIIGILIDKSKNKSKVIYASGK